MVVDGSDIISTSFILCRFSGDTDWHRLHRSTSLTARKTVKLSDEARIGKYRCMRSVKCLLLLRGASHQRGSLQNTHHPARP